MKRVLSIVIRIAVAAVLLLVVVLLVCLDRVDLSPWSESPLKAELQAALNTLRQQTNTVLGPLRAGFGRARLTPRLASASAHSERGEFEALPLAGYGARRGRSATGVHDELWVKAVALAADGRTGIVLSADALIIPYEVAEATASLLKERGIERGQLYFGATHAHSSIGGWGRGVVAEAFAGPHQPGIRTWFSQQLASAAAGALDDLDPAETGLSSFTATNCVRNRLVGDQGGLDANFRLLTIVQDDGDRAVLGSYSAHATVLPATVMEFSGDYPGAWANAMEKQGAALAVFLAGGVGSHGPRAGAPGFDGVERMGRELAAQAVAALNGLSLTNRVAFGLVTLPLHLPPLQVRITDSIRLRPWVARQFLPVREYSFIQALRLGEAVWLSTPSDFSGELVVALEGSAASSGRLAVTSFNGDYVGYVIPEKYYHLGGYEPQTMSFFGPQLPGYISAALQGLLEIAQHDNAGHNTP